MTNFDQDPLAQLQRWQRLSDNATRAADPFTASALASYETSYPWMAADAKWSLAKAGIDPASSTAQAAAYSAAHIETNQGLGFASVGSPVTKPSGPVDTTSVFGALEARRQNRYTGSTFDPAQNAAAPQSQLAQINPDGWKRLQPNEQQALANVQIVAATADDIYADLTPDERAKAQAEDAKSGAKSYKVAGFDQLPYFWQQKVAELLTKAVDPEAGTAGQQRPGFVSWDGHQVSFDNGILSTGADSIVDKYQATRADNTGVLAALAPLERASFMVGAAPYQEITGQIRNLHELVFDHTNPNWLQSQSDLGIAAGDVLSGRPVDVGSGFFVGGDVSKERERRIMERGTIGGQGITLGRAVASLVFQPGSKPYQTLSGAVDFAAAIKLDPTVKAAKEISAAREAQSMFAEGSVAKALRTYHETGTVSDAMSAFQAAGGLAGIRPTVSKDAVNAWLSSPDQAPLLQHIADNSDPYAIWRGFNRQADPVLAARLADTSDPAEVASVLRDELGTTIRYKPSARDVISARTSTPSRWASMMPANSVESDSVYANALQLERAAALVKAPDAQLATWFDAMARTQEPFDRLNVWQDVMRDTNERLLGKGVAAERANRLTRLWQEQENVDRVYSMDAVGKGLGMFDTNAVLPDGSVLVTQSSPHLLAQALDGNIPLPDWRALRTSLSPLRPLLENEKLQSVTHAVEYLQNRVWKALQVSTVKTMIKVLGDEQAAIAGRGYDSLFSHPLSALSIVLGSPLAELPEDAGFMARLQHATKDKVRWAVEHVPGVEAEGRMTAGLTDTFDNMYELKQAASRGFDTALDDRGVIQANDWQVLTRTADNTDQFTRAWARDLAQYAASPESRGFLRAGSLEQAQAWYWDGPGAQYRETLSRFGANGRPELLTREGSDRYVDLTLQQMQAKTNGNPDLVRAIASGRLGDASLWAAAADGTPRISQSYVTRLADYLDDAPLATRAQKAVFSSDLARKQVADGVLGRAMHVLLGAPSAVLSKSPLFRQAYWDDIVTSAPFMTADAQNAAVRIAENEANVGKRVLADLRDAIASGNRNRDPFAGTVSLDQADTMAKGHALEVVRTTTHDFSQRNQQMDLLRIVAPFGEVWRKTIRRWAGIINENPAVIRRAQQGIQALQSPELGAFLGGPAGQGFFHTDQYGQEVFTIPGSQWATQALTGVPVPLVGNVRGLSLGTEIFPALGPVASIPVAWTMNKLDLVNKQTPLGTFQEVLFPYGAPKNATDLWNYAPSWLQKAFGADRPTSQDSVRTFNNAVKDVIAYGWTNGDYDMSTPAGIQHAFDDAEKKAHSLYWIRGASQFLVPGAPAPEWLVRDKTGKLLDAAALVQEYRDLQNADPNTAGETFLSKYGPDIFRAATTPKSYSYIYGLPTSPDSVRWVDEHSDVKRDLPHIFGYFAPPSDPNDFDYQAYQDQLLPGQGRAPLTADQWVKVANSRLAALQYGIARDRVEALNKGKAPNDNQRVWMAVVKQNLMDEYPGYADALYGGGGLPERPDPKLLVREAQQALDNPTARNTEAGKGLASYLQARSRIDDAWVKGGYSSGSWAQANNAWAVQLRGWLRRVGGNLEQSFPQFGPLFEGVFQREMRDDTNPADLQAA